MSHRHVCLDQQAAENESGPAADRWRFAVSGGLVRIQPIGPTLTPAETVELIECVRRGYGDTELKEIVFDLAQVKTIGPQWTLVLGLLISFACSVKAHCRVISLHEQPANVVGLYRRVCKVAGLVVDQNTSDGGAGEQASGGQREPAASKPWLRSEMVATVV